MSAQNTPSYTICQLHEIAHNIAIKSRTDRSIIPGRLLSQELDGLGVTDYTDADEAFGMLKWSLEQQNPDALTWVEISWLEHLIAMFERNLRNKNLADSLFDVESRIIEWSDYPGMIIRALKELATRYERRIEIEAKRIDNLNVLNISTNSDDVFDPAKRGLSRQLAMLLLDELFPNLGKASNTAKAEFLHLLTGWSKDGLRNKWSDYRLGSRESLAGDEAEVAKWKVKLKIND